MRLLKRSWAVASTSVLLHSCFIEVTLKVLGSNNLHNIDSDDNDDEDGDDHCVFLRQEDIQTIVKLT